MIKKLLPSYFVEHKKLSEKSQGWLILMKHTQVIVLKKICDLGFTQMKILFKKGPFGSPLLTDLSNRMSEKTFQTYLMGFPFDSKYLRSVCWRKCSKLELKLKKCQQVNL